MTSRRARVEGMGLDGASAQQPRALRHGRDETTPTDPELMRRAAAGDARAFEALFDRHAAIAFSLAVRICGRRAMAEDVVQEAFLSVWRNGAAFEPARGSVRSWLLSIVRNRSIDALRRAHLRESRNTAGDDVAERIPAPELTETEVVRRDDARRVRAALESLPPEQRRVIELAYFGGLTHGRIAQILELPAGTVKGRMRLGLQKLRVALEPLGASDTGSRLSTAA